MFIDYAIITVKAGDGGDGCVAFRREKYVPKGGPSGGDGGKGGDIVLLADEHIHTLLDFRYTRRYKAKRGQHGQGSNKTGRSAEDVVIKMPVGTIIKNRKTGQIVDLIAHGQRHVIARGGKGGRGNAHFVTPTHQAPREWEPGRPGEEMEISLELKLLADVGLVGLPNAGKSTLLSRISAAKPKIADYPFTTLVPNLGIVRIDEYKSFVMADIPGLIEGAHAGKGLGHQFLRHIERTKILLILLDITSENIDDDYRSLINELQSFSAMLVQKKQLIVYTKGDLVPDQPTYLQGRRTLRDGEILISAVRGDNLQKLLSMIWTTLEN
ncbi:GTPase ObgE [candidate division KSB1 bacterium]|nr:GTPase ObgE [candidate division KSB1 bacterium]RQW11814.1 MAG: GTPase ObgE [candidate division KSB1 bacterium]